MTAREVVRAVIGLFNRSWTDSGGGEPTHQQHRSHEQEAAFQNSTLTLPLFPNSSAALLSLSRALSLSVSVRGWKVLFMYGGAVFRGENLIA